MLSSVRHKMVSQELINLNNEKLLQSLKQESRLQKISAKRWGVFINEYQSVYPVLSKKLWEYKLSKTEFRLAVFLSSELSNFEISELLGVNIETVYIQRNRLSKKFSLDSVKELDGFIADLKKGRK